MQSTVKQKKGFTCQHCNRTLDTTIFKNNDTQSFFCPHCGKENFMNVMKERSTNIKSQQPIPLINNQDKKSVVKRWVFSFIALLITGWLMTAEFDSVDAFAYSMVIIGFFIVIRRIVYFIDNKMNEKTIR